MGAYTKQTFVDKGNPGATPNTAARQNAQEDGIAMAAGSDWTSSSPTPTPSSGAFGSGVSASLAVRDVNEIRFFRLQVTIGASGAGTASGAINVPLGKNCVDAPAIASGKERQGTGAAVHGEINASGSIAINRYDNTTVIANSRVITINGWYRIAP